MLKVVSWMLAFSSSSFATDSELPKPLSIVEKQGGEVISRFDAPSQMTGYVIDFKGNAITVYITEDGQYMLAGKMFDANGQDVGANELNNYINGAQSEKIWQQLSESSWVLDGNPDASRVIYAFTDPNCPYCQKFWQQARPWVDAGNVQIRHILVGILKADSYGKSAAILSAENPSEILHNHEAGQLAPLKPLNNPTPQVKKQLDDNHRLMRRLGLSATPAIYFRDESGAVKLQMGLPTTAQLETVLDN